MDRLPNERFTMIGPGIALRKNRRRSAGQNVLIGIDAEDGIRSRGMRMQIDKTWQEHGVGQIEFALRMSFGRC